MKLVSINIANLELTQAEQLCIPWFPSACQTVGGAGGHVTVMESPTPPAEKVIFNFSRVLGGNPA